VRSAPKTALLILYNVAFVCAAFGLAEYIARRQAGSPGSRIELRLDRWTAFRNNPSYNGNQVQLNQAGFRSDRNVALEKPPGTVRIFLLGGSVAYGGETLYPEIDDRWRINNHQTIDYDLEQRLNAAFPANHWEVINAAVKGYFLNQDLALYLSALQRYHPDYLILLDGVNDLFATLRSPDTYDSYSQAGLGDEFDGLTGPASMSLRLMSSTWLLDHSSLYRLIRERVSRRSQLRARTERIREAEAHPHAGLAGMTADEQHRYQSAASKISGYMLPVRQIHRLAALEGTKTLFVLQPQIAVTRKRLTSIESRLLDYWSKIDGQLYVYGFQTLYPHLSSELADGAQTEGYQFLDLTGVFDHMSAQTFTDYCHLTPAGDQAVADAIFDSLAASMPVRAGGQAQ
jgi:lysophospholipase L1-like esterase